MSKVSIIMPVFNAEKYVHEAMESVLSQAHDDWELIVVNDGSVDGSETIIQSFQDERIHCSTQKNGGVSAARNAGLKKMTGDFFCFLDADDRLTPNSLKDRVKILENRESVHFVDGTIEIFDSDSGQVVETRHQTFSGLPKDTLLKIDNSCFFGPTWMIRRNPDVNYRFLDGLTHGEDLLFYMSIADQGEYVGIDRPIYQYRSGNQSAMGNLDGLWEGYQKIYWHISKDPSITASQLKSFGKKIRSIMFKSYLGHWQILNALKVLSFHF